MFKRLVCVLLLAVSSSMAAQSAGKGQFELKFDDHGITSLKRSTDSYDTDFIADEATLGHVTIR